MGKELKDEFNVRDDIMLRTFRQGEAEMVYEVVDRNRDHLQTFMHWMTPDYSLDSAVEFIDRATSRTEDDQGFGYGIFQGEKLIGSIGFVSFDWKSRRTEIGYWIDKEEEGKGIISASCAALIDHAFAELGMNRIEIRSAAENKRSAAIPERFGFKKEGVLRKSEFRNGRLQDFVVYGLLADEWRASRLND